MAQRVAVIGAGAIGTGFACVFADAGAAVVLAEPDPSRRAAIPAAIAARHEGLSLAGRARGPAAAAVGRVEAVSDAAEAAGGATLVIEAGPEQLAVKRPLLAALLAAAPSDAPVCTASSALTVSEIVADPARRTRCLVAHPLNPPTVIRVLELVPSPETAAWAEEAAAARFAAAGFLPVPLGREVPGFVMNRLQGAMLREAYRLVAEGVVDATALDRLVREGLGPRWALSGPFETADLNTPGGIAAHAARMGPAYRAMGEARGERDCAWPEALVAEVERQRRAELPAEALPARVAWRERAVARLVAARDRIAAGEHG
jgi:3-hydroxyacyl-CoA dehydrogenase